MAQPVPHLHQHPIFLPYQSARSLRNSDNSSTLEPIKDHLRVGDLFPKVLGEPLGDLLADHISRAVGRPGNGLCL